MTTTAFVGTYPPHPCGVAAFVYDLATAAFPRQIVAILPEDGPTAYPAEAQHRIRRDEVTDYRDVAAALDRSSVDVASVHFDPDLWGGEEGSHVVEFLRALHVPAVTTMHALPPRPSRALQAVVAGVVAESAAVVALSEVAAGRLARVYGIDPRAITMIPYGIPNLPLIDAATVKPKLGLEGRRLLVSFGLLRPDKGLERMLEAMPRVIAAEPTVLYAIIGTTDATWRTREGDAYRDRLVALASKLRITDHVRFEDRFVGRVELARWVEGADVIVAPSLDPERASSGSLAYAMGAGRAIVTSPSALARERLSKGRGLLVEPEPGALADAVIRLLGDDALRTSMGRRAHETTRDEVWSSAGAAYGEIFARVARKSMPAPAGPIRASRPTGH